MLTSPSHRVTLKTHLHAAEVKMIIFKIYIVAWDSEGEQNKDNFYIKVSKYITRDWLTAARATRVREHDDSDEYSMEAPRMACTSELVCE